MSSFKIALCRVSTVAAAAALGVCCGDANKIDSAPAPAIGKIQVVTPAQSAGLLRGKRVAEFLARRPTFSRRKRPPGLRCNPDGDLKEWKDRTVKWITVGKPVAGASRSGESDLSARIALASYERGLSLALVVRDDAHRPAKHIAHLASSDSVTVELTPLAEQGGDGADASPRQKALFAKQRHPLVGVRFTLGSFKQLVRFERPRSVRHEKAVSSFGSQAPGGWQVEARVPLTALTPLPVPRVRKLRYRITINDSDSGKAEPSLRFTGLLTLTPAMRVPEAIERRVSVRACMALYPDLALWSFKNGWRCAVPHARKWVERVDDSDWKQRFELSYVRMPKPPKLTYLRERVVLINFPGLSHGAAALFDMHKRLVSLLPLGVIGSLDPGNALTKDAGADPLRLPDGTYAVAITHAEPQRLEDRRHAARSLPEPEVPPFGSRCARGHHVYLSILALRGAPKVTPHKEVPPPDPPPHFAEVFRAKLEDCDPGVSYDWSISRDRSRIKLRDSLHPEASARVFVYRDGFYQLQKKAKP